MSESSEWRKLGEVSTALMESRDYKKTLGIIVRQLASLSGARRACVVIENMEGKFVVKAGYPVEGHGIDTILTPAIGEEFLKEIIENGEIEIIDDPKEDSRTSYMREMVLTYDITKIIFLPLAYQGDALGALVLDFCNGQSEHELPVDKIQVLANLAASAIGSEYERRRSEEKLRLAEELRTLGEESAKIAHELRNFFYKAGGWLCRANTKICECIPLTEGEVNENLTKASDALAIVIDEMEGLRLYANGVLEFSDSGRLQKEEILLNRFLEEEIEKFPGIAIDLIADSQLDTMILSIDRHKFSRAITNVIQNAIDEGANTITVSSRFSRRRQCIDIELANNGKEIRLGIASDLFSPFCSDKPKGTGLGLPIVRATMLAHGGDIILKSSTPEQTTFLMTLPLL